MNKPSFICRPQARVISVARKISSSFVLECEEIVRRIVICSIGIMVAAVTLGSCAGADRSGGAQLATVPTPKSASISVKVTAHTGNHARIPVSGDLSADELSEVTRLVHGLPEPVAISRVAFAMPTAKQASEALPGAHPQEPFLTAISAALADVDVVRAQWQAQMLISAVSREFSAKGFEPISGGTLSDRQAPISETQGALTWFTELPGGGHRYVNSTGKPSKLNVDPAALTSAIDARAAATGATAKLSFGVLAGTNVEVDLTVDDPYKWATSLGYRSPLGDGDSGDLEGYFIVVKDKSGTLIKCFSYSSGEATGSATYGHGYDKPPYAIDAGASTSSSR